MKYISKISMAALVFLGAFALSTPASAHVGKTTCKFAWKNGKKVKICKTQKHCHSSNTPKQNTGHSNPPMSPPPYHGMPPKEAPNPMPKTTCHAEDLQYLIGRPRTDLMTMRFIMPVRIEEPGNMYTMEYSAERLRIIVNEKGIIAKLMCG